MAAFRPILIAVIIIAQFLMYSAFLLSVPQSSTDFASYYALARIWKSGGNPYNLAAQCEAQVGIVKDCLPMAHPPLLLPVLSIVSDQNVRASFWRWVIVLLLVLVACAFPLYYLSQSLGSTLQALLFYPVVLSVFFANDIVLVLFAVAAWVYLLLSNRDFLSGVVLSVAVVKPHLAVILAIPLLFTRPKAFIGFCIGGGLLILYSLALVGPSGFKGIIEITLAMAKGVGYRINQSSMINITGILARAGISTVWAWPLFVIGILSLCYLWKRSGVRIGTISLALIIAIFISPHAHTYDLALLTIPVLMAHRLAPLVGSAVILFSLYGIGLGYVGAFAVMLPLALFYAVQTYSERDLVESYPIKPVPSS